MATERLPMRRIREILRLRRQQGLSVRETARALGVSVGVVSKTASRAEKAGVTWEVAEGMADAALEERLYGRPVSPSDDRPRPNPVYLHTELSRPGVTLEVLHLEYLEVSDGASLHRFLRRVSTMARHGVNDRPLGSTADRRNGSSRWGRRPGPVGAASAERGRSAKRIHPPEWSVHHVEASCWLFFLDFRRSPGFRNDAPSRMRTWASCSSRSIAALARSGSPNSSPISGAERFDVIRVALRS
jgi:transcriptional regulator with XRE-family HTH domain